MLLFKISRKFKFFIISIVLFLFQGCGDKGDSSNKNNFGSVSTMKFSSISSGGYHTCGLLIGKNSPVCWGKMDQDQSYGFDKVRNIEFE